jgi:hypothetical protein
MPVCNQSVQADFLSYKKEKIDFAAKIKKAPPKQSR